MTRVGLWGALGLAVATLTCGVSPRSPGTTPSAKRLEWTREISPFPVSDAAGIPLDLPFLGGFNHPRPQLVDIDADGRLDLFVQEHAGSVMHFVQDGTRDGVPRWRVASLAFQGIDVGEWYRFADLDGDGDVDLLAESPFSYVRYWRNAGTAGAPRFVPGADTLRDVEGAPIFSDRQNIPQLGDLDCNGLVDLLIGKLDGTVARYELAPSGGTDERIGATDGPPRFRLLTEEFEGIRIIGEGGPQLAVPRRPGGSGTLHGANTMALADYDGDGDLDLFWGDFFEPGLLLIENTGSCESPNMKSTPVPFPPRDPVLTSGYNAPAFGALGGDGLDLVMGVLGGAFNPNRTSVDNLYLLSSNDGVWRVRTRRLVRTVDVGSESIPALVDLDGDGDLDLLVANKIDPDSLSAGRLYHFENIGTASAPAFRLRGAMPFAARYHYAPAFGDLDGDGRPDLILGHWGASLAYHRGTGGGVDRGTNGARDRGMEAGAGRGAERGFDLVDSAFVTITRGSNTTPTLGDLDGDGLLDLVIGEASGYLNYYRNEGTRAVPRFVLVSDEWLGIRVGRRSAPHLVDLDGDGDLDLLVGSELDGVWLLWNEGTRTAPVFVRDEAFDLEVPAMAAPATGDLDGDGQTELIVGGVGGGVVYFRPSSSPSSRSPFP